MSKQVPEHHCWKPVSYCVVCDGGIRGKESDPTPLNSLPLSGYLDEIKRLTHQRDELLDLLRDAGLALKMYVRGTDLQSEIESLITRIEGQR